MRLSYHSPGFKQPAQDFKPSLTIPVISFYLKIQFKIIDRCDKNFLAWFTAAPWHQILTLSHLQDKFTVISSLDDYLFAVKHRTLHVRPLRAHVCLSSSTPTTQGQYNYNYNTTATTNSNYKKLTTCKVFFCWTEETLTQNRWMYIL